MRFSTSLKSKRYSRIIAVSLASLVSTYALIGCGSNPDETADDCSISASINSAIKPAQERLQSSGMSTYDDPGEISARMTHDYGEIAKIIDGGASRMSDSDVRKSAETLAESYATISASLQDQENASDQPVQEQLDRGAEMLGALAMATTEYRNQCPSNP